MKITVQKGFITQRIGDKITIFDSENSLLLTLNSTATFIFDRLKKGLETKKIAADLANKFNVSEKDATKDIDEFTKTLIAKGLAKKENTVK